MYMLCAHSTLMMTISVKGQRWFRPRKDYSIYMENYNYKVKNKRMAKYLYSLGFERKSFFENGTEYWMFRKNKNLQEAVDFYFNMRKKNRE